MISSKARINTIKQINMIKQQLRTNDVHDKVILSLFDSIPRHEFVPAGFRDFAYSDMRIPLAHDQQMMTPEEEGRLLQALHIGGYETILEVGTGSGYLTALLSRLGKKVISIDCFDNFTQDARRKITALGFSNVELITADASHGFMEKAPYDVLVITSAIAEITETLRLQLFPGGKLFAIVGKDPIMCGNLLTLGNEGQWHESLLFETNTPPLIDKLKPNEFCF